MCLFFNFRVSQNSFIQLFTHRFCGRAETVKDCLDRSSGDRYWAGDLGLSTFGFGGVSVDQCDFRVTDRSGEDDLFRLGGSSFCWAVFVRGFKSEVQLLWV